MADVPCAFLKKLVIKNIIIREFLGEFLGTFILILIGDAGFAQTILAGKGVADVFAVTWAWGVGVMFGVLTCGRLTGGHINPVVTVSLATLNKFPWRKVGHYVLAQHLGGFVASAVLFVTYKDALDHFDPNRTVIGPSASAYIWATYPNPNVSILNCFLDEIVATGIMMFTIMATLDTKNMNIPKFLYPILFGFMISAVAMCFGLNCMAALNPARDFATRAFTAIAGYGADTFSHRNYWWIGIVPTHLGGILGAWLYYLGVELHWPENTEELIHGDRHELTTLISVNERKGAA